MPLHRIDPAASAALAGTSLTRHRKIGLRLVAAMLVLAATVPLAIFAAMLAIGSWRHQTSLAEQQSVEMARAVSVSIDKEIESAVTALNVLASVGVREPFDADVFRDSALKLIARQPGWLSLILIGPGGIVIEDTADRSQAGVALTAAWARQASADKRAAASDLLEDPATRRHFLIVAVPVARGDERPYVLAARIAATRLAEVLRQQNLPHDALFTLFDGHMRVVARDHATPAAVGEPAPPIVMHAVARGVEGSERATLPDGARQYLSHSRSALTGWTVGMSRPADAIDGPIRRSMGTLINAGIALLAIGLIAALAFGHVLVRAVEAAKKAAKALARGERVAVRDSRLAELDDLWRGLADAQAILDQRLAERDAADRERLRALAAERIARHASEEDRARLAVTLRSIGDGVLATDAEGRVTMMNEVAQKLTGWSEADALGRAAGEVFLSVEERTCALCTDPVAAVRSEGRATALSADALLRARDGRETPIAASAAPIRAPDGTLLGAVLVFRDVTQARAAEHMRAALLEREQAARRTAEAMSHSKDEFVAMLSHELRTPLAAIYGWTRLLRRGLLDAPARERALEVIERNTRAQTQLIDDLLDMSRMIRGSLRLETAEVDLAAVLAAAADSVRPMAQARQLALEVDAATCATIRGDADRLQQVFCNVLNNAIKFTTPGGRIEIGLAREGSNAVVRVRDNGIGIAPDVLPHIFEPFRQGGAIAARARGGLGIGLALVRHLVRLHGGSIAAASEGVGRGATFTIRLPALPEQSVALPAGPREAADDADAALALVGIRVLAVDDDPDAHELVSTALRAAGAHVRTAASVAEACGRLADEIPDVVLTDIGMPGASGFDLLAQIRADPRSACLPVIALTAYDRREDRADVYRAGFDLHVGKPVEPLVLARAVALVVRRARKRNGDATAAAATAPQPDTAAHA